MSMPLSKAGRSHCPSSGSALQAPKRITRYKNNANRNDIHSYAITLHSDRRHDAAGTRAEKSFELVRNALSDVIVVTFDELLQRLIEVEKKHFSLRNQTSMYLLSPVCFVCS